MRITILIAISAVIGVTFAATSTYPTPRPLGPLKCLGQSEGSAPACPKVNNICQTTVPCAGQDGINAGLCCNENDTTCFQFEARWRCCPTGWQVSCVQTGSHLGQSCVNGNCFP